jgi:hypothetical protein
MGLKLSMRVPPRPQAGFIVRCRFLATFRSRYRSPRHNAKTLIAETRGWVRKLAPQGRAAILAPGNPRWEFGNVRNYPQIA